MIKKIIFLVISGLLTCSITFCQKLVKHEVSIWGTGGSSTLKYDLKIGKPEGSMGGAVGVGYTYFFAKNMGIGTGVELAFYKASAKLNRITNSYMAVDPEGEEFLFQSTVSGYKESQNATLLNIPIMLHLEFPMKKSRFYAAGGLKIGIPIYTNYKVKNGTFKNTGYYEYEDHNYEGPEALGFGTFQANRSSKKIDLDVAAILALEAGFKWKLQGNPVLYTGVYFDYGLNDIGKDDCVKELIEYNSQSPREFIHNSMLTSQYVTDTHSDCFTNKIYPMAFGVKIRLAFNLN